MAKSTVEGILAIVFVIAIIAVISYGLPALYNQGVNQANDRAMAKQTNAAVCSNELEQIRQSTASPNQDENLTIALLKDYSANCRG